MTPREMPEPYDFDQVALNLVGWLLDRHHIPVDVQSKAQEQQAVAAQLRHVWNARGAALIDPVTNAVDEWVRAGAGTYDELQTVVEQAIESLDR